MAFACISIGSNLNQPSQQVARAIELLAALPDTALLKASGLYETKPWGILDQPGFINAVAGLETELKPIKLLDELQKIEATQGRVRDELNQKNKWEPRTLDLDIVCYDQLQLNHPRLKLPHPYFSERSFVLEPLVELYPQLSISGKIVKDWLRLLEKNSQG